MKNGKGFIAALDQSGGSTPKALKEYGVNEDQYSNEDEMFQLVHDMRTRVVTSPSFSPDKFGCYSFRTNNGSRSRRQIHCRLLS